MAKLSSDAFVESLVLVQQSSEKIYLERAIHHGQAVLSEVPSESSNRTTIVDILAALLTELYNQSFDPANLKTSIEYCQEAVDLTPAGNPDRAGRLNNLSNRLSTRYERDGKLEDLTQAIEYCQEAVDLTPAGNPDRAAILNSLSNRLSTRYERDGKLDDLMQAIEYGQEATLCLSSPPSVRIRGCLNAIRFLAHLQKWEEARALFTRGLEILPYLISNLSSKLDQENIIKSISGLAVIGCVVSLECSNNGYEAI